jgi:hypothetical protein
MNRYLYDGPVMEFDACIDRKWKGITCAVSENKAKSNLAHQYKQKNNKVQNTKITLPGKLETFK